MINASELVLFKSKALGPSGDERIYTSGPCLVCELPGATVVLSRLRDESGVPRPLPVMGWDMGHVGAVSPC